MITDAFQEGSNNDTMMKYIEISIEFDRSVPLEYCRDCRGVGHGLVVEA